MSADETAAKLSLCAAEVSALMACSNSPPQKTNYVVAALCKERVARAPEKSLAQMKLEVSGSAATAKAAATQLESQVTALERSGYPAALKLKAAKVAQARELTTLRSCTVQRLDQERVLADR